MATKTKSESILKDIKRETAKSIWVVLFFAFGIFLLLPIFGIGSGQIGKALYVIFSQLLGKPGYIFLPLTSFLVSYAFFKSFRQKLSLVKLFSIVIFVTSGLGLMEFAFNGSGGIVGSSMATIFIKFFGPYAPLIFFIALIVISLLLVFESELKISVPEWIYTLFSKKKRVAKKDDDIDLLVEKMEADQEKKAVEDQKHDAEDGVTVPNEQANTPDKKVDKKPLSDESFSPRPIDWHGVLNPYDPPPLSLLEKDRGKPGVGDIKSNANIIKRTLQNFGVDVEMDEVSIGPSVTRYALKPAEGVKLSRIVALQNDLSLALAAHPIRIEAPIPGKSLVGIEIPNGVKTIVGLATLLSADEYVDSEKPLMVALGKSVSGKIHFANIAKMPHLLIAGATGSGKSVTIHALITSLLYRNSPENMKLILIDPKRVELTLYNKIPHLLTPVITEPKKAILALKWAAKEMDRRYDILESESVRDIESYHKNILAPELKKISEKKKDSDEISEGKIPELMPYIVIVIDELADIMSTYPRELEASVVRLAQMSRAVGIHLVLSTQRPSVNVITGLIKANIPSRIALQVASQIDSRTILDGSGAEKLLGAGDMLYLGGEMAKPLRLQSAYISENEVKHVVKYLADNYVGDLQSDVTVSVEGGDRSAIFEASIGNDESLMGDDDPLYEEAREEVLRAGKASTSYLQRKLRIGYSRAARLIDLLEAKGVIGPGEGAKPREVIGAKPMIKEDSVEIPEENAQPGV